LSERAPLKGLSMHARTSDFDVIILGAGVVGVNSAYWNLRNGKSVCVVDRQPQAGLETSFANGGQVSVSHAEPWANPSAPFKILKWLLRGDAPLLFRPDNFAGDPENIFEHVASYNMLCVPREAGGSINGLAEVSGPQDNWRRAAVF